MKFRVILELLKVIEDLFQLPVILRLFIEVVIIKKLKQIVHKVEYLGVREDILDEHPAMPNDIFDIETFALFHIVFEVDLGEFLYLVVYLFQMLIIIMEFVDNNGELLLVSRIRDLRNFPFA